MKSEIVKWAMWDHITAILLHDIKSHGDTRENCKLVNVDFSDPLQVEIFNDLVQQGKLERIDNYYIPTEAYYTYLKAVADGRLSVFNVV